MPEHRAGSQAWLLVIITGCRCAVLVCVPDLHPTTRWTVTARHLAAPGVAAWEPLWQLRALPAAPITTLTLPYSPTAAFMTCWRQSRLRIAIVAMSSSTMTCDMMIVAMSTSEGQWQCRSQLNGMPSARAQLRRPGSRGGPGILRFAIPSLRSLHPRPTLPNSLFAARAHPRKPACGSLRPSLGSQRPPTAAKSEEESGFGWGRAAQ